jgi:hypothetical protein
MASLSLHLCGEAGQADDAMNCQNIISTQTNDRVISYEFDTQYTTADDDEMTMTLMSPY